MKYVTSGFFNAFLVHFKDLGIDLKSLFAEFDTELNVLENSVNKVNVAIFFNYLEELVRLKKNHRIGLEAGFQIPFLLTGTFFNLYHNCTTVNELFGSIESLNSTANNFTVNTIRIDSEYLYYEISVDAELVKKYPIAARQWYEMQYGIDLQYAYSFTNRFLHPVQVYSVYPKEGSVDLLEEYLDCPVKFKHNKAGMVFKKSVLNLPVITNKKELLPVFESMMGEIEFKQNQNTISDAVRRYLIHNLSGSTLGLKPVTNRFNMSERSIQRKLRAEGTSYQQILNDLRAELAHKYIKERIPLLEIAYLLGFESKAHLTSFFKNTLKPLQSGFCKLFYFSGL